LQKRNNHFVPRFYLKGFLDNRVEPPIQPSLWVYDKKTGEHKKKGVGNVGAQNGYYDLKLINGQITTIVEDFFKYKIEDPSIPVLRKILKQSLINDEERLQFSNFIYFSLARVPNFLNYMSWFYKNTAINNQDTTPLKDPLEDYIRDEGVTTLEFMIEMADIFVPLINSMNWQFYLAPKNKYFVTSDNPVILNDPTQKGISPSLMGWNNPNIQLTFPLDSSMCLLATWGRKRRDFIKADSGFIRAINFRTVFFATRYVFSSRPIEVPLIDIKFLFNEEDIYESKNN